MPVVSATTSRCNCRSPVLNWCRQLLRSLGSGAIRRSRRGEFETARGAAAERLESRALLSAVSFTSESLTTAADGAFDVTAADIDSDGIPDLLVASSLDNSIRWYRGNGGGSFTPLVVDPAALGAKSTRGHDHDLSLIRICRCRRAS